MSVESVTTVETLHSLQEAQTKTEAAIALGVQAAKKQPKLKKCESVLKREPIDRITWLSRKKCWR